MYSFFFLSQKQNPVIARTLQPVCCLQVSSLSTLEAVKNTSRYLCVCNVMYNPMKNMFVVVCLCKKDKLLIF